MFENDNHLKNNPVHQHVSNNNNLHVNNSNLVNNLEPFKMAAVEDKESIMSHLRPSEISHNFPGLLHQNAADSSLRLHPSLQGPKHLYHCHNKNNFWNSNKDLNRGQSNRSNKGHRNNNNNKGRNNNNYHNVLLSSHNLFNNVPLLNPNNNNFLPSPNFKASLETVKLLTNLIWAHSQPLAISKDQCSLYSLNKFNNNNSQALVSMLCVIQ